MSRGRLGRSSRAVLRLVLALCALVLTLPAGAHVGETTAVDGHRPSAPVSYRPAEPHVHPRAFDAATARQQPIAASPAVTDTEALVLAAVAADWHARLPACPLQVTSGASTYNYVCALAAGHSFSAVIARYETEEDATAAFAAQVGDRPVADFHGFVSAAWQYDDQPGNPQLPLRHRLHTWHALRWLFLVESFDDTTYTVAPDPAAVAEQVYQAAMAAGLFPLTLEGEVLQRVAEAWRWLPPNCPTTVSFEAPATYAYRCSLAAGHELYVSIRRHDSAEEAQAAFDAERGDAPVVDFHGHQAIEWTRDTGSSPALPLRYRGHRWVAERWLFDAVAFDDTGIAVVPPPIEAAHRVYEAALARRLLTYLPPDATWDIQHLAEMGGVASAVAIDGQVGYIGIGGTLHLVDLADPARPRLLRTDTLGAVARDVVVSQGHVFVALGEDGLYVAEVRDPSRPTPASFSAAGTAWGLFASGRTLYVARWSGLDIYDIADPVQPALLGSAPPCSAPMALDVADGYAYVACLGEGLWVYDVRDPAAPSQAGRLEMPDQQVLDVAVSGHVAYLPDGTALNVVDLNRPAEPRLAGTVDIAGGATGVTLGPGRAYVGTARAGLTLLDIADPAAPRRLGEYLGHGDAGMGLDGAHVAVAGTMALIAGGQTGAWLVDVGTPTAPREVAGYGTAFSADDLQVLGDYAYIAAAAGGLRVIDVSNPLAPRQVGALRDAHLDVVAVANGYAFGASAQQFTVISVAEPTAPRRAASLPITIDPWPANIDVEDGYAYVAGNYKGPLLVFDVRDPTRPRQVAVYHDANPQRLDAVGRYVYFVAGSSLQVLDVSDPTAPARVGYLWLPGPAWQVRVAGHFAYVGAGPDMLLVVDVSAPTQPRLVGALPGHVVSLAIAGNRLFASGDHGTYLFDLSQPTDPRHLAWYPFARYGTLAASGNHIYRAISGRGFVVLWTGPLSPAPSPGTIYLPAACRACALGGRGDGGHALGAPAHQAAMEPGR